MSHIITISLTDEDYDFLRERMKKGSKPSHIFRNALDAIRRQVKMKDDLTDAENARKFERLNGHISNLNAFIEDSRLAQKFEDWLNKQRKDTEVL